MNKREIIATLIEVSNDLDSMGMFAEADVLTKTAEMFGDLRPSDFESNPDNAASEAGFLGEDAYNQQMLDEEQIMNDEARLRGLTDKQEPSESDLAELDALLNAKFNSQHHHPIKDESDFASRLQDAGADLNNQF